ncbi:MAG: Fe-S cluster assembly protein SufD [Candidatus Thiodiazotropha lotti]|nr:Fe-S cluster assembly protein SufD [Candidatus Thiodiazotropha lotti]ODC00973.1 Fe-S cluster assembly protein SufD [Candidatus Thiodiazotropha endoloripes]MCG7920692.1 Fe-S cluster assembly protein SufD [Candidatus Thiodiazotropha lotti]MCG7929842.1 Fe-S cluster assembly protein SufD [Candidatus Thiodiazotropha lotti]MCG7989538.1 Fe-S cluster assembly protein SufD [Candidatus Thiodiazotropha lotti]
MILSPSDYKRGTLQGIESLPMSSGDWMIDRRLAALERFETLGFPDRRSEAWRYTSVEGLLKQGFTAPAKSSQRDRDDGIQNHLLEIATLGRLVFIDGQFIEEHSVYPSEGVRVTSLKTAMATGDRQVLEAVGSLSGLGDDGFAALNLAGFQDGAVIRIAPDVRLDGPMELLHLSTDRVEGHKLPTRHLILLERGSQAELIERFISEDQQSSYFNHQVVEISLAEQATLSHKRIQMESRQAYHLSDLHIALQSKAAYYGVMAAIGGCWSRTFISNRFQQPDAHCELDGLYLVDDGQLTDFHLDIDHQLANCSSRENFKGILRGAGKAVFDGLIQVGKGAQKSEAHLHNANLMLSRQAEVDTKPQLTILADDVICSHGTSVGQLDDQAIFYLRSRGLDEQRARALLCQGFLAEIIEKFEHQALIELLNRRMNFVGLTEPETNHESLG